MKAPLRLILTAVVALLIVAFFASNLSGGRVAKAAPRNGLSAPTIQDPANGAQFAYEAQPFVFNWNPITGAVKYRLQISKSSSFSSFVYNVTPTSDGWAAQSPLGAATYYWRVRGINGSGGEGPWSQTRRVIVQKPATIATPVPPTATPVPVLPQNSLMAFQVPYHSNSVWNMPIGANPAYDRNSSQMIAMMGQGVTGGTIYSDTTRYNYPVYWADASTPRYNIPCVKYKCSLVQNGVVTRVTSLNNVPIPNGAKQADGTDAQMIIIDTQTGIEYGFYEMVKLANGTWQAGNGYQYSIYSEGTVPGFGSRGAGVPYYAGLIRPWEIRQGRIDHAIAFVYQFTAASKCVFPATKTDGKNTSPYAIPQGARLQLNPNLTEADFDRMGLSRAGRIVARAMQQYGMILIDSGGSPKIIAENLTANTLYGVAWSDPDLQYTKEVIAGIPYTELRVLALPDGYYNGQGANYSSCIR